MNRRTMTAAVLAAPVLLTVAAFGAEHPNKVITKLAKEGNANAQVSLGQMYVLGLGVPQDHAQAVKWYTLAAEQGHARAQYTLGRMYATAHGVPQDYRKAAKWFRKAAEQGQPDSQAWLGALFAAGRGIPQNLIEAHAWTNLAAAQGKQTALDGSLPAKVGRFKDALEQDMTPAELHQAQNLAAELHQRIETHQAPRHDHTPPKGGNHGKLAD